MIAYTVGTGATLAIALAKKSDLGWGKIDTWCVGLVVLSLGLWAASGQKTGLVCSLIASVIGSAPMLYNLGKNPENEPRLPWGMILAGSVVQTFALPTWDTWTLLTPMTLVILQMLVLFLIFRPHLTLQH